uniref:Uncharacterized protein n=1 Tax=Davidia involucrata TaxID=16924 RepID=A0A5B6YY25_DAVIN
MGLIDMDDSNCVYDERLARRLRRRRLDIKAFELNTCSSTLKRTLEDNQLGDEMVDEDYNKFLNHLGESRCSGGEDNDDDDEDDTDPQYKMFLEKLKEDGKSYILEVENGGMSVSIKYEVEDGSDGEHEPPTPRQSRDVLKRVKLEGGKDLMNVPSKDNMKNQKNLRNILSKDKMETSKNLSNGFEKERRNSVVEKDLKSVPEHPVSWEANRCWSQKPSSKDNHLSETECGRQMVDESYQAFLNCIKLEGDCVVLAMKDGKRVKYDEDDVESSSDSEILVTDKIETQKNLRNISSIDKMETPKNLSNVLEKERRTLVVEKDLKSVPVRPVSHETNGCWNQKPSQKDNHLSKLECQCEMVGGMVDESYQTYLHCNKQEGDCLVLETKDGKRVKYEEEEEDVESSSDSEILVIDNALHCDEGNYNPFVTSRLYVSSMEGDDWQCVGNPNKSNHSQFREKVLSILRRPYDHNEYEELLQEIIARKPMEGHRDLRGRIISYPADKCSKSYLDHYSDLRRKIDAAQFDRRIVLNLLRGFFYWLKNLSHVEAFRPWLDTACLTVMPGNR